MRQITVKDLMTWILERRLQMDDFINFRLSDDTEEMDGNVYSVEFSSICSYKIDQAKYFNIELNLIKDE